MEPLPACGNLKLFDAARQSLSFAAQEVRAYRAYSKDLDLDLLYHYRSLPLRRNSLIAALCTSLLLVSQMHPVFAQTSESEGRTMHTVPIDAPIPAMTIDAGSEEITGLGSSLSTNGDFNATGGVTVVGGTEFLLRADSVTGNLNTGVSTAVGHVFIQELDSTLDMDSIFVEQKSGEGTAQNVHISQPPYTITAQKLLFLPNENDAYSAMLSTCPPSEKPEISIRSRLIQFFPERHEIVIHDAAVYLWNTKLFVDRRLVLHTSSSTGLVSTGSKLVSNTVGYNGFSGAFINFTTHFGESKGDAFGSLFLPEKHGAGALVSDTIQIISSRSKKQPPAPKTLIGMVRRSAEATQPILPYGDPLLMHWFQGSTPMSDRFQNIPYTITMSGSGTVSIRERVYGRYTNDLFYSRVPEISFSAVVPISGPRELPTSRDPAQMRTTLRQIALYAVISPTLGRYSEVPDDVNADRDAARIDLESRPILIGDNLLFKPRMTYVDAIYPDAGHSFRVLQADAAIEKYLTSTTGYGLEYQQSSESGTSPFQFDTPYTSREIDGRFQVGYPRVIVGGLIKYDLNGGRAFSEELLIAPVMRSLVPRFTYDFATKSFGLGFDIQGLTY